MPVKGEAGDHVMNAAQAAAFRDGLAAGGRRLVFTNGCFDLLHVGHVRYLQQARALGDALLVALNGDDSVRMLKGPGRPVHPAADRAEILCALACVDAVVVFEEERVTGLIAAVRPHIYAKGGDYTVESLHAEERRALEAAGAEIRILPLVPGKSTSATLKHLHDAEGKDGGARGRRLRLGVLGSGEGTNFEAICEAIDRGDLDAELAIVITDVADSRIRARAVLRGVPDVFVHPGEHATRLDAPAQKEIRDRLVAAQVDLVVLAGFLRVLKEPVLGAFAGRIVNIHPSLLPAFKGLDAPGQALAARVTETGCTVHFVTDALDAGEIIAQEKVPVFPNDTAAGLRARIREKEHALYPRVIGEIGAKILRNSA